jgi:hypothetical protein
MPYKSLPSKAFWKKCNQSDNFACDQIYDPKFAITSQTSIATAGSCFAQNIGRYLKKSSANLLDVEPGPVGMSQDNLNRFGYGLYSGRYGNIYSAKQLRQLVAEVLSQEVREQIFWQKDGRYYDALRPTVEPDGFSSADEVISHRRYHIARLLELFKKTDVFIFTLGLTESWLSRSNDIAYPTCPGVVAGRYSESEFYFQNARYPDIKEDVLNAFSDLILLNSSMKFILSVSPVALAATATGKHVLSAATYSKSTLRAVAGDLATDHNEIDYFPSYEIFTGTPFGGRFYKTNFREVNSSGVELVMKIFFEAHELQTNVQVKARTLADDNTYSDDEDESEVCEDVLLESF